MGVSGDPIGLKSRANGELGEARVRALLLERFIVHTRSVDIDGADFLVELRDGGRFSDELAPRLGIVQAKFAQDAATSHEIAPAYVSDGGVPISEFFVLVTVGREDEVSRYLLSGAEVADLPVSRRGGKDMHVLSAKTRSPFRQRRIAGILDRIEKSLRSRTEAQNERFLRTVNIPDFELKRSALAPTWRLPIPNEHAYVPDAIYRSRIIVRSQLYALDGIVDAGARFMKDTDAIVAAAALDDIIADRSFRAGSAGDRLVFDLADFVKSTRRLKAAVRLHKKRVAKLRRTKLMPVFIATAAAIRASHRAFIETHRDPRLIRIDAHTQRLSDDHALTRVDVDPVTREPVSVTTDLVAATTTVPGGADVLARSRALWRFGLEEGPTTWRELDRLLHELMADFYRLLFPDEPVGDTVLPVSMAE